MRLFSWQHFNLPTVFSRLALDGVSPPKVASGETRPAADALDRPFVQFYNPDALHFPDHNWANPQNDGALPGNHNVTLGVGMVTYDHQSTWNRHAPCQAGPVREFFKSQYYDNRIKQL